MTRPVLELSEVAKDYRGLRPLRIARLAVAAGDQTAIVGMNQAAAEVLVSLVSGATLPDRGEVRIFFGRPITAISDSTDWLAPRSLDHAARIPVGSELYTGDTIYIGN